jgi:hypothetical protein
MTYTKNQNKSFAIVIALILVSSIAMPLFVLSSDAATANTRATYAFAGLIPDHTGVGQGVTLHVGIIEQTSHPQEGWTGLTVTVTKPDNTTETLGPFTTDTTGGTGATFVPDKAGTYYFQTHFPQQVCIYATLDTPANTTMLASDSAKATLTVTEEPISYYPGQALPSEYWSRPIDSQLREWSTIAGNWLMPPSNLAFANKVALSNAAPETAHILWSRTDLGTSGSGLVGGAENDAHGYYTGDAYEGKFSGSVIISGVLYYNTLATGFMGAKIQQEIVAVDLHTGEELWRQNWGNASLSFGQVLNWETPNGHGAYSYLWTVVGSTWNAYDPLFGTWEFSLTNIPGASGSGPGAPTTTNVFGPNGEILRYFISGNRLLRWNSTWAVKYYDQYDPTNPFSSAYARYSWLSGHSAHLGTTMDASHGIDMNVSMPVGLQGGIVAVMSDRIIGANLVASTITGGAAPSNVVFWGISTKAGQEGTLLFNTISPAPSVWISGNQTISFVGFSDDDKVGTIWSKEGRQFYGVSLETGKIIWGPTATQHYTDSYQMSIVPIFAYGNMYEAGVAGELYCYDVMTGDPVWSYNATDIYVEEKLGPNWWLGMVFVSDGKLYVGHNEHSSGDPKPRGAPFLCFNATTGDVIWSIDGAFRQTEWGGPALIGDSIIATMDSYDQKIYAIGKGPSSTTVSTSPSTLGNGVTIMGTVNDVSPGTSQEAIKLRFPNGVPAVSDASQSDWMLYVYKQFSQPSSATGVSVTLSVVDANNNYREIGTTTSDASGFYSFSWTPDISGKYTLYASFAGSESYYASHAVTAFTVDPAVPTPAPTEAPIQSTADLYFVPAIAGLFIFVAIIGVVIILVLRKRP